MRDRGSRHQITAGPEHRGHFAFEYLNDGRETGQLGPPIAADL